MQGSGSGLLNNGGSYVTLTDGSDYSIVIEKMSWAHSQWLVDWQTGYLTDCDSSIRPGLNQYDVEAETATFTLSGEWATTSQLYVWRTQFGWDGMQQTNSTFFEQQDPITVVNGQFTLTINPDELYTITTLSTGNKAELPTPPASQPFPTSYADDFESYAEYSEARYFADQAGTFEIYATNTSHGNVMRQTTPTLPICWSGDYAPFSVIGDVSWSDAIVTVDVLIETTGAAFVGVQAGLCCLPNGIFFSVNVDGTWALSNGIQVTESSTFLQSGSYDIQPNTWYTLTLSVVGSIANAWIGNDQVVNTFWLPARGAGWVAIGTSQGADNTFTFAQFDNFNISSALEMQCDRPSEGTTITTIYCGGS